mmetsp:Transcript_34973/g.84637  ORF Transcript_34973/g.84637 Transcript_34973/m.84637 type:complete len:115 (-) Transcript_34973:1000-1344(-)
MFIVAPLSPVYGWNAERGLSESDDAKVDSDSFEDALFSVDEATDMEDEVYDDNDDGNTTFFEDMVELEDSDSEVSIDSLLQTLLLLETLPSLSFSRSTSNASEASLSLSESKYR